MKKSLLALAALCAGLAAGMASAATFSAPTADSPVMQAAVHRPAVETPAAAPAQAIVVNSARDINPIYLDQHAATTGCLDMDAGSKAPAKPGKAPGKGGGKKKCMTAAGPGEGEEDAGTPPASIRILRT